MKFDTTYKIIVISRAVKKYFSHKDFISMKPSVIASNYNHGHFINEQIESIVNQA